MKRASRRPIVILAALALGVLGWAATSSSVAFSVADTTKPVTTIALTPAAANGSNGWYKTAVTLLVSAADTSGVAETRCVMDPASAPASFDVMPVGCPYLGVPTAISGEGQHVVYAASRDNAGNKEAVKSRTFKIDLSSPGVTLVASGSVGSNRWFVGDVTVHADGSDQTSGIWSCTIVGAPTGSDLVITAETKGRIVKGSCRDKAGWTTSATPITIKLDKTPPVVSVNPTPAKLWPPNHQLRDVDVWVDVADATSGSGGFLLTSVTSNEPDEGLSEGDEPRDVQGFDSGTPDTIGQLRAERSPQGNGRAYTLTYTGVDQAGNPAVGTAVLAVAHNSGSPIVVPDEFATIQEAIDNADPGDKIIVKAGTYAGAIVRKAVDLVGTDAVIDSGPNTHPYYRAGFFFPGGGIGSGSSIRGFLFQGTTQTLKVDDGKLDFPIFSRGANDVTVERNTLLNSLQGISNWHGNGWRINHNTLDGLWVSCGGGIGILIASSDGTPVRNNVVEYNDISADIGPDCAYYSTGAISLYSDARWDRNGGVIENNVVAHNKSVVTGWWGEEPAAVALEVADFPLINDPLDEPTVLGNEISFNDFRGSTWEILFSPEISADYNLVARNLGENRGHGPKPIVFEP